MKIKGIYPRQRDGLWLQAGLVLLNIQILIWSSLHSGDRQGNPNSYLSDNRAYEVLKSRSDDASHSKIHMEVGYSKDELKATIWSTPARTRREETDVINALLGEENKDELHKFCGRTLYHGITNVVVAHNIGQYAFFATGYVTRDGLTSQECVLVFL